MAKDKPHDIDPDDLDTYDIVEPIDEEPVTKFDPSAAHQAKRERMDRGVDLDIDTDTPPPPPPSGADYSAEAAATPRPKILEGIPEPKFVDPEVQATRREEQRVRAAQEMAEEEARKRALKVKIAGTVLLVVAVIGVFVYVFM